MEVPDVMSWLIDSSKSSGKAQSHADEILLQSDSRLLIVAGR